MPEEFHRFLGAGFEDDAQVVRGNTLAIEDEQVDFRRQGQEGGHQQPVEVRWAFEHAPDSQPGQQLKAEHLPGMLEGSPQQRGDEGHGRQQGIRQEQEQSGRAKQEAHKGGAGGQRKMSAIINPFVVLRSYKNARARCLVAEKECQIIKHHKVPASAHRSQRLVKMPQKRLFFAFFYSKKR